MIGVDESTAEADACKMEHIISEESFQAIKKSIAMEKSEARKKNSDRKKSASKK